MLLDSVLSAYTSFASVVGILLSRVMSGGFVWLEIQVMAEVGVVVFNIASFMDRKCSSLCLICVSRGLMHSNDEAGSFQTGNSAISKITAAIAAKPLFCRHSHCSWET